MRYRWKLPCPCVLWILLVAGVAATNMPQTVAPASALDDEARHALSGAWTLNATLSDSVPNEDVVEDRLLLTIRARTATFYQRDGSWQTYQLSGRRERQDLGSGLVWTTAAWNGTTLRLEIEGARGIKVIQTFSIERQTGRLVVVSTPDPRRLPMNAVRLVYDRVVDRTP